MLPEHSRWTVFFFTSRRVRRNEKDMEYSYHN